MKIEIEIDNPSLFTQVARVLDNPKIREGIVALRSKWTGGKMYSDLESWRQSGIKINFRQDLAELLLANEISPIFLPVLEEAVINGKVTQFTRVVKLPIPRHELAEYYTLVDETLRSEDYEYVLVTPLDASRNEVTFAFGDMKNVVKDSIKRDEPEDLTDYYELKSPNPDTKSEVRTHRDWYWMHLRKEQGGKGMSYFEIAQVIAERMNYEGDEARDKAHDLENTVQKSVNAYKALVEPKA